MRQCIKIVYNGICISVRNFQKNKLKFLAYASDKTSKDGKLIPDAYNII